MKQHLSISDLNELSKKGKERLLEWWKPEVGNCFVIENDDTTPKSIDNRIYVCSETDIMYGGIVSSSCFLPLLSIGQMIEFLEDHDKEGFWHDSVVDDTVPYFKFLSVDRWCDALWEAVKEILEK